MDLKVLIYSKNFDTELTGKLLYISDSSTLLEDLIDLIGEMAEELKNPPEDCDFFDDCGYVTDLTVERDELENELGTLKSEIKKKVETLQETVAVCDKNLGEIGNAVKDLMETEDLYDN